MNLSARIVAVSLAALLLVSLVPTADAVVSPTFGAIVKKAQSTTNDASDVFFDVSLSSVTTASTSGIRFWDCDADGLDNKDPFYVDVDGSGGTTVNDIRITTVDSSQCGSSFSSGTKVGSSDGDRGKTFSASSTYALCFLDSIDQQQNDYNPTEIVFISTDDASCTDGMLVDDICFVGSSAGGTSCSFGSRVTNAATAYGTAMPTLQFEVYDVDNSGSYSSNDGVYMDVTYATEAGYASPGDIRLTSVLNEAAGTVVEKGDIDVVYRLTTTSSSTFAPIMVRETADSTTCSGSTAPTLYVNITGGGAAAGVDDFRWTAATSLSAGTFVKAGEGDVGVLTTSVNSNLKRADVGDNNNVFDAGDESGNSGQDVLFYDSNGDEEIDENEVTLSRTSSVSAATCVASSTAVKGLSAETTFGGTFKYFDSDASGHYNQSATTAMADLLYLDMDNDNWVTVGDVRLFPSGHLSGGQFGDVVDSDDVDVMYKLDLLTSQTTGVFCFQDTNGDNNYDAGETVYLRLSAGTCGTLAPADVRLTSFQSLAAGRTIRGGDQDNGIIVLQDASTEAFRYFDIGTSATNEFQDGDVMYIDFDGSAKISIADIVLTGVSTHGSAGEIITAGDTSVLNGDLVAFTGYAIRGFDIDGDETFSTVDLVVWDDGLAFSSTRFATPGDVFLTGSGGTTSSFSGLGQASGGGGGGGGGTSTPQPQGTLPVPVFTCSGTLGSLQIRVDATDSYDPDGTISSYEWSWGDGTTAVGSVRTHRYDAAGEYTVSLTVVDNDNRVRSGTKVVAVPLENVNCLATPTDDGGDGGDADEDTLDALRDQLAELLDRIKDTDGDGFPDVIETREGTDPNDADEFPGADADTRDGPGVGLLAALAALGAAFVAGRRRRA